MREIDPDVQPTARRASSGPEYRIIIIVTVILTALGLFMVLSASAVGNSSTSYRHLIKQGLAAALGLGAMWLLSRLRIQQLRKLAWPLFGATLVLLLLVQTPLGQEVNGARRWISLGAISLQPSELAKLAALLWGAQIIDAKRSLLGRWSHLIVPYLLGIGTMVVLVLIEKDLGTTMMLMLIMLATLFYAGLPLRKLAVLLAGSGLIAVAAALLSPNRLMRLLSWANCAEGAELCRQGLQGQYALASGGWWGVGLGQSRQKWHWIPEGHTDFIFAILGEELGLLGSLAVLLLFGVLAVAIHKVSLRTTTTFSRCICSVTLIWLVFQAILNIAMVIGLTPVTGVPLTFISYGGSSLLVSLAAIGLVLSVARNTASHVVQNPARDRQRR
ncbi:putative lipid II flippase FtsW [Arthrobacter rhombi]|uniref:putative lipid II flippase FtsW n=1 Tax=Arthrobacter rhombi TaxID=71253 RepID=UPI003FCF4BFA